MGASGRRGRLSVVLGFLCYLFVPIDLWSQSQEPVDPGALFLESFGAACGSRGVFTQRALNDTAALKRILESIKNDAACQGLVPLFAQIVSIQNQFEFYKRGLEGDRAAEFSAYGERLAYALSVESDPYVQDALAAELADARVSALREDFVDQAFRYEQRAQAVQELTTYMEIVSSSYPDQINCFERHKSLPIQLAGQLLSIAGGFFDPALNLALGLSGRLISSFFSFFDNLKLAKRLRDYRKTTMQAGLTCAMEALEQTLCDIESRRSLIDKIQEYRDQMEIPQEWLGYEVLTREYATYQKFLRRVEAGSPAGSEEQGNQKAKFREREGNFYAKLERISGTIGQAKIELSQYGDNVEGRRQRVRKLVSAIASHIVPDPYGMGNSGGPLQDVIIGSSYSRALLWIRLGNQQIVEMDTDGNPLHPDSIVSRLDSGSASHALMDIDVVQTLDIVTLESNVQKIIDAARRLLDVERQVSVISDDQGTLAFWTMRDHQGFTPERVGSKIVFYLNRLIADWEAHPEWFDEVYLQQQTLDLARNTRDRFQTINAMMSAEEVLDPWKNDGSFVAPELRNPARLRIIYDVMVLKEKDQVITDRLSQVVETDLQKRLQQGLLASSQSLDTVIRLAERDLKAGLQPGVTKRLESLKEDLDEAEPVARDNLYHFFKHFQEPINDSIKHLVEMATIYQEGAFGVSRRKASKLCILSLNDPMVLQNKELLSMCEGAAVGMDARGVTVRNHRNVPIQVTFSKQAILETRPEKRICTYRRFRNEKELYEDILKHRPPRWSSPSSAGITFVKSLQSLGLRD